jgi:hypothetical protein
VFGVPRSGTKALARALNLHPHVYCAIERFSYQRDHSGLVFPDSFTRWDGFMSGRSRAKVRRIRTDLAGKDEIHHVGNKQPRYYLDLERLNREVPRLQNLWIYRSPSGFVQSWNRREARHRATQWRAGQVGLFGLLELLVCIDNCARLEQPVFVFPYDHGLNESTEPILRTLDFLGADRQLFDLSRFESRVLPGARDRNRSAPSPHEQELIEALQMDDLDRMLGERCGILSPQEKDALRTYLDGLGDKLPKAVDRAFRVGADNPAVTAYGTDFFQRYRQELQHLIRALHGSETLARFQRPRLRTRVRRLLTSR